MEKLFGNGEISKAESKLEERREQILFIEKRCINILERNKAVNILSDEETEALESVLGEIKKLKEIDREIEGLTAYNTQAEESGNELMRDVEELGEILNDIRLGSSNKNPKNHREVKKLQEENLNRANKILGRRRSIEKSKEFRARWQEKWGKKEKES